MEKAGTAENLPTPEKKGGAVPLRRIVIVDARNILVVIDLFCKGF